ncbi:MAG: helix-turn-helix domain-containing protein [Vicinamibacteria bacterium]
MPKAPAHAYHQHVDNFKRELLTQTLLAHCGNRTHAAKALGLQRTYLLRLMRELGIQVPPSARACRNGSGLAH